MVENSGRRNTRMFVTSPVFLDSNFLCEVEEQKQQKLLIKILD